MTFACLRTRALTAACAAALTACLLSTPARAGVANAGAAAASQNNPLAGLRWGLYTSHDEVYPAYLAARGEDRRLLGRIALQPRVRWFGAWYDDPEAAAREYIRNSTGGDADVLSQLAVFRLDPWEGAACRSLPTAAQQASYRQWIDAFAAGIGSARVAMILQPDLPFEMCVPHHSQLPMRLVSYAAQVFSALPRTSVYIDAGAADWASVSNAVSMLRAAGVRYTRGFALNGTHYDSTAHEIMFGQKIARALAGAHIPGRHFVINTSDNGRPFTYQQYHGQSFDNAAVCQTGSSQRCVTLGIPPTTNVASAKWGLSARARRVASRLVDAYLWFGRPWLVNQAAPFDLQRSLQLARTTPF
jgi:endoglucanase